MLMSLIVYNAHEKKVLLRVYMMNVCVEKTLISDLEIYVFIIKNMRMIQ